MPRATMFDSAPVTARRYVALFSRLGDDDMFSSDLTDAELADRLGHLSRTRSLVLMSGGDEYIPNHVDKAKLLEVRNKPLHKTIQYNKSYNGYK